MTNWDVTDGWILAACAPGGANGTRLDQIIAHADFIEHSIPTAAELSRSFSKLASHGVLRIRRGKYFIDAAHLPAIHKALAGRGGLFASADKCFRWLKRAKLASTKTAQVLVTDADVLEACASYRDQVAKR